MRAVRRAHALARPDSVDHTMRTFQTQPLFALLLLLLLLLLCVDSSVDDMHTAAAVFMFVFVVRCGRFLPRFPGPPAVPPSYATIPGYSACTLLPGELVRWYTWYVVR